MHLVSLVFERRLMTFSVGGIYICSLIIFLTVSGFNLGLQHFLATNAAKFVAKFSVLFHHSFLERVCRLPAVLHCVKKALLLLRFLGSRRLRFHSAGRADLHFTVAQRFNFDRHIGYTIACFVLLRNTILSSVVNRKWH